MEFRDLFVFASTGGGEGGSRQVNMNHHETL